ncbi:MAG: ABC transporter ATP-binding protein [Nitrososphaerota archaeon]|nr:ABC transporter ATP-binding protein [Nitrososphaerota archaeon]
MFEEIRSFFRTVSRLLGYNSRYAIVLLFLSLLIALLALLPPLATKMLYDSLQKSDFSQALKWVVVAVGLLLTADLGGLINSYFVTVFEARITVWLRERFAVSLYHTDKMLNEKWDTGYVIARYKEVNDLQSVLLEAISVMLTQILILCTAFYFLFLWIPMIALVMVVVVPITSYLSFRMKRSLERKATEFQEKDSLTTERLGEIVQKWRPSVFQTEDMMISRHNRALDSLFKVFVSYQSTSYGYQLALHALNGGVMALFWLIGLKEYQVFALTLGVLAGGSVFLSQSKNAVEIIIRSIGQASFGLATYRRVAEFVEEPPTMSQIVVREKVDAISFNNVSLEFEKNKVIDQLTTRIRAGEWLAFTGENGSGKTSLLRLVAGLKAATSGKILINNSAEVPYFSRSWMSKVTMVEPEPFILDGTILENITLKLDGGLNDSNVRNIFGSFGYRCFWDDLPNGLLTMIGSSQNSVLSYGQRQMVEWARWIYQEPLSVYLLDEPLGGLVREVKLNCLKALRDHASNSLVFLTTQDTDLIRFSDQVITLKRNDERSTCQDKDILTAQDRKEYAAT